MIRVQSGWLFYFLSSFHKYCCPLGSNLVRGVKTYMLGSFWSSKIVDHWLIQIRLDGPFRWVMNRVVIKTLMEALHSSAGSIPPPSPPPPPLPFSHYFFLSFFLFFFFSFFLSFFFFFLFFFFLTFLSAPPPSSRGRDTRGLEPTAMSVGQEDRSLHCLTLRPSFCEQYWLVDWLPAWRPSIMPRESQSQDISLSSLAISGEILIDYGILSATMASS